MASTLLKTLQNVKSGHTSQIKRAKDCGFNVKDNASFEELASYIGVEAETEPLTNAYDEGVLKDVPYPWVKPEEWPDGVEILNRYPDLSMATNTARACIFVLMRNAPDVTDIEETSSPTKGEKVSAGSGCTRVITSDGQDYRNPKGVVHTWDPSKDIIIETGRFPGRYRWMVLCYNYLAGASGLYLTACNPIYVVVRPHFSNSNSLTNFYIAEDCYSLVAVDCDPSDTYTGPSNIELKLNSCPNLEYINSGNLKYRFTNSATSTSSIRSINCDKLSEYRGNLSSGNLSLRGLPSLRVIDLPKYSGDLYVSALTNMRVLNAPQAILRYSGKYTYYSSYYVTYSYRLLINPICKFNVKYWYDEYPQYLTTTTEPYAINAIKDNSVITTVLIDKFFDITNANYSVVGNNTTVSYIQIPMTCCKVKNIVVSDNFDKRINLKDVVLMSVDNVLDIFNKLKDLTNESAVTSPIIKIPDKILAQLTESDLKIATDKGWVVE